MVNLTFGEQVKIILSRRGMTIKQLAELVEQHTGKPMSRQNMTQRLGRDNFQEQDMRLIAEILGCEFKLSIMETTQENAEEVVDSEIPATEALDSLEREIMVGELIDIADESKEMSTTSTMTTPEARERELLKKGVRGYFKKAGHTENAKRKSAKDDVVVGDINPYTGKEYKSNSVRIHPKRIGYVQVYDQEQHKWTDMTEWAFLGYQERKKVLLGKDYEPPIYLD